MKKRKYRILAVVVLCLLLALELYRSNRCLSVDCYQISTEKAEAPVRIVLLADLHDGAFGRDNEKLLSQVARQAPDLILFAGDLVTAQVKDTSAAMNLVEQLVKIAPVYISVGNHEQIHRSQFGSDLTGMLEYRGAKVLEYEYEDIQVNGQSLRIGGISGYCMPERYLHSGEAKQPECAFLRDMAGTDACTVLMCHMPYSWIRTDALDSWDIDLVCSGHVHGGQWVLPLLGPVVAPDMGFFPGRLEGIFPSADGTKFLAVTRGLGNSVPVPRLNNAPQILVLDILPK